MIIIKTIKQIQHICFTAVFAVTVVACGATNPPTVSEGHIKSRPEQIADKESIPQPVTYVPALPFRLCSVLQSMQPAYEARHSC